MEGQEIATCPSCSLQIKVIFDEGYIQDFIKDNGLEDLIEAYWEHSFPGCEEEEEIVQRETLIYFSIL